jgi:hypothetical protein
MVPSFSKHIGNSLFSVCLYVDDVMTDVTELVHYPSQTLVPMPHRPWTLLLSLGPAQSLVHCTPELAKTTHPVLLQIERPPPIKVCCAWLYVICLSALYIIVFCVQNCWEPQVTWRQRHWRLPWTKTTKQGTAYKSTCEFSIIIVISVGKRKRRKKKKRRRKWWWWWWWWWWLWLWYLHVYSTVSTIVFTAHNTPKPHFQQLLPPLKIFVLWNSVIDFFFFFFVGRWACGVIMFTLWVLP